MEHCIARDASKYFCAQPESVGSVNRQNLPRRILSLPVAYRGLQFVWKLWATFLALISNHNIHIPILGRTMVVGAIGACTFTEERSLQVIWLHPAMLSVREKEYIDYTI